MSNKRLALVGAGLIGKRHIDIISKSECAQLVAIADPAPDASAVAEANNVPIYKDVEALLAAEKVDGVIIASPNQLHVEQALHCLEAKIPVLIEKPIASIAAEAARLVEVSKQLNVPILVGHHRRHNPLIQAAKEKITAGDIGKVVSANAMFWLYKPDDYYNATWRTKEGAGPVFINLIHDVDLLRYLCGDVAEVHAFQSSETRGLEVEDSAVISLRFKSGALASINVSDTIVAPWSWELTAGENPAYPETSEACYWIGGTHGSIEIPKSRLWTHPQERSWWSLIEASDWRFESAEPLDLQLSHFCDVIDGKSAPLVSGEEGLKTLEVIEAIKTSAQSSASIRIEK